MPTDERASTLRRKIRENNYAQEELTTIAEAFQTHESVCYPLNETRLTFLLKRLCEGLTELAVLPVCLHIPGKKEFMPECLLVIDTGDQADFRKVCGHTAKDCGAPRFLHMMPEKEGITRCGELISSEDGFTVHGPRKAKLILASYDHYLVVRSLNSKM